MDLAANQKNEILSRIISEKSCFFDVSLDKDMSHPLVLMWGKVPRGSVSELAREQRMSGAAAPPHLE